MLKVKCQIQLKQFEQQHTPENKSRERNKLEMHLAQCFFFFFFKFVLYREKSFVVSYSIDFFFKVSVSYNRKSTKNHF